MSFFYATEINNRKENQDFYCHMEQRVNHEALVETYVVADGMGGMAEGDVYARTAVTKWYELLLHRILTPEFQNQPLMNQVDLLETFARDSFEQINQALYQRGLDLGQKGGTTLSVAIHFWDSWIFANVGDSPIYYMGLDGLVLASELQNLAGKMVREKRIEEGSLLYYQNKNRLIQYLGKREAVSPWVLRVENKEVKAVILGSDGAFGNLSREQIQTIIEEDGYRHNVIPELFSRAKASGETDNQTAIYYCQDGLAVLSLEDSVTRYTMNHGSSNTARLSDIVTEADYVSIKEKSIFEELRNRIGKPRHGKGR